MEMDISTILCDNKNHAFEGGWLGFTIDLGSMTSHGMLGSHPKVVHYSEVCSRLAATYILHSSADV